MTLRPLFTRVSWTASALLVLAVGCGDQGASTTASATAKAEPPAAPPPSATPAAAAPASAQPSAAPSAEASASATASGSPAESPSSAPAKGPFPESKHASLRDPAKAKAAAPEKFRVNFDTTAGEFEVECHRDWAPNGVDRFFNLVKIGFFDDNAFFRVVKEPKPFVVQFGIHGNPEVAKAWSEANLPVDKVKGSNTRGTLTFAMAGAPTTRATQVFFNLADNARLDKSGFAPICEVTEKGMEIVDKLEGSYGDTPSREQARIQSEGNKFLRTRYPKLDYIKSAKIVEGKGGKAKK